MPIKDQSIKRWKLVNCPDDPLANFDGAKRWNLTKGFKKLIRPLPMTSVSEAQIANGRADYADFNQRSKWIPLQKDNLYDNQRVSWHGLAYSFNHPYEQVEYNVEITLYVKFKQFVPQFPIKAFP